MTDPTKLHRLFSDQFHVNNENRSPVRGVVHSYDGVTAQVFIPSFDGGQHPFPVDYSGANFQPGDLVLVCRDEADTYWIVGTQSVGSWSRSTQGGSAAAGGGSNSRGGGTGALPKNADKYLNPKQQAFAQRLNADIGLEPCVICGWVISENGKAAASAPNGANNWLNMYAFDTGGWAHSSSSVWSDPTKAADATASFMLHKAVNGVNAPEYSGAQIPSIPKAAGKSVDVQVSTIQNSGWASGGYPNLGTVVKLFQ